MAFIEIVGYTEAIKAVEEWAEAVQATRKARLEPVLDEFVEDARRDAVRFLNRPNWLLSRAIGAKRKNYDDGRKMFGMTGFVVLQDGGNPYRNPGEYGRYHESGFVEELKKPKPQLVKRGRLTSDEKKQVRTVALHFLKRAEMKNQPKLIEKIEKINADIADELGEKLGRKARNIRAKVGGLTKWR